MIDISRSGHYVGDCRELLKQLPERSVHTCITSPPYWGLRDYGVEGQLGLEETPEQYVINMVEVFDGVWRALRDDGTLWLNIGDCYAGSGRGGYVGNKSTLEGGKESHEQARAARVARGGPAASRYRDIGSKKPAGFHEKIRQSGGVSRAWSKPPPGYKEKELVGIPWMLAFALRARGWYLRLDIIWAKPNPLPEPVLDRPTRAHEYVFLMSKRPHYSYDADIIREPLKPKTLTTWGSERRARGDDELVKANNWARDNRKRRAKLDAEGNPMGANKRSVWRGNSEQEDLFAILVRDIIEQGDGARALALLESLVAARSSVWTVGTQPYDGAHFAVFPPDLVEPCVLAGARVGDIVLDPFFGSGTTGQVAEKHGRRWIGFDINPAYEQLQKERTAQRSLSLPTRREEP